MVLSRLSHLQFGNIFNTKGIVLFSFLSLQTYSLAVVLTARANLNLGLERQCFEHKHKIGIIPVTSGPVFKHLPMDEASKMMRLKPKLDDSTQNDV